MNVFAVFKNGVYRHECGGVFDSLEKATEAAEMFRDGERDDHHSYEVVGFELNTPCMQTSVSEPRTGCGYGFHEGGEIEEPPSLIDVGSRIFDS